MLFHTFEFLVLLTITVILYYAVPKSRIYIISLANIIFYGASGLGFLALFGSIVIITYFCALKMNTKRGRLFFFLGLAINVLNLSFFKYTGFILSNIERFFNVHFIWQDALLAKIILPVGISFYTFQLIAYLVDVYKKEIEPCRSLLEFWVFIAFFAQLVAGPIMRGNNFLPQIKNIKSIRMLPSNMKYGIYYILMGLTKKIVFADLLASRVDYFFSNVQQNSGLDAWYGAYLFAFQIYFDFSAYSEIAIGVGKLFGLDLTLNFKSPYISDNPSEFWSRWHITLSSWIRDYIYIPLGGSRKGLPRQLLHLIIAMCVSGLWHGAAWTFVAWGLYHGLLSVAYKIYGVIIKKHDFKFVKSKVYKILSVFIFFQLTTVGWVFFRANSISEALILIKKMLDISNIHFSLTSAIYLCIVAALYLLHIAEYYVRKNGAKLVAVWEKYFPAPIRAMVYTTVIIVLILFTKGEENSFIYFQF